jgi:hypothetical protein
MITKKIQCLRVDTFSLTPPRKLFKLWLRMEEFLWSYLHDEFGILQKILVDGESKCLSVPGSVCLILSSRLIGRSKWMTKNYYNCAKRDKHLIFDVFSSGSVLHGCQIWNNCDSFLSFTRTILDVQAIHFSLGSASILHVRNFSHMWMLHGTGWATISVRQNSVYTEILARIYSVMMS